MPEDPHNDGSVGELVSRLHDELAALFKQELRLAQLELAEKVRQAALGGALLAGAGAAGGMAAGTASALLLRMADKRLPPATAATVVTLVLGGISGALAIRGVELLSGAWPAVPEQTIAVAKDTAHP
jgi:uncharacterized membrane protein YqjE